MKSQIQLLDERCRLCRQHFEETQEEHEFWNCFVTHSTTWEKGDWAQEPLSKAITLKLEEHPYSNVRKGRFIHKRTPRSQHGYDDFIIDIDNMEAVVSDTKNCIASPYDSSYLKTQYFNKHSIVIDDCSDNQHKKKPVKIIARAIAIFGGVEKSCLTICKKEGVEVIHETEHCLPDQNAEAIERTAKSFVDYAMEQFIKRDNERAFDRLLARAQKGGWRRESRLLQCIANGGENEEDDIPSLEESIAPTTTREQPIPPLTEEDKQSIIRSEAKSIYEQLVFGDFSSRRVFNWDLQWFSSQTIIVGKHRLASKDGFTTIDSDSLEVRIDVQLYQAFMDYATGEEL